MGTVSWAQRRSVARRDALAGDHLWCRVVRTAAARLEEVAVGHDVRQAKVADLDVEELVEQEAVAGVRLAQAGSGAGDSLLRLEVAVHDLVPVRVFDGTDDLLEEAPCLVLRHAAPVDDVLEQLAAGVLQCASDSTSGLSLHSTRSPQ